VRVDRGDRLLKGVTEMRVIALLSVSIAILACSGCASLKHPKDSEPQETKGESPHLDLSRALHNLPDWAER
jgi:hypothetical protein